MCSEGFPHPHTLNFPQFLNFHHFISLEVIMPRSDTQDSDHQSLLSHDPTEMEWNEKLPRGRTPSLSRKSYLSIHSFAVLIIVTIFLALTATTIIRLQARYSHDILNKHCGSTPEDAIALGCRFDVLNYSWQPEECFNEMIYNRYWEKSQEHGPLKWYADSSFTQELPQDLELLKHTPYVWTGHRFHVVHCMYGWELFHHSVALGLPMIESISHFNHTMHCADTALDEELEEHLTSIKASYNRCVFL